MQALAQKRGSHAAETFIMTAMTKRAGWVVLVMIGMAGSAPLDQERIYFPGENPELEQRSYGLQPNVQQSQMHHSYHGVGQDVSEGSMWPQDDRPLALAPAAEGADQADLADLTRYQEQHAYGAGYGGEPLSALQPQYAPVGWPTHSQQGSAESSQQASSSYGASGFHHAAGSPGGHMQNGPSPHAAGAYSSMTNNGVRHEVVHHLGRGAHAQRGDQKVVKHSWTSHHSATGSGELHHGPQYAVAQEAAVLGQEEGALEHSFSSAAHQAHGTNDLAAIIGGPPHQGHELHPAIQQALDNVMAHSSAKTVSQPSQHRVHKISHIKKTSIQNVGQEPVHIQSTSSNDDISLSHLIEELKMLENSPRHVNITWCEEKIKEFLQSLRRKQASGVYINQKVQEETLHQILTHEEVENTDSSGGVYEPLMTKVTVRPLGAEHTIKSHAMSETISHHQESHIDRSDDKTPPQPDQSQGGSQPDTDMITIIPQVAYQHPEIMAHQHESFNQPPPLTSDNTEDLQELDLDLPEYVPFEHSLSGDIQAAESNIHRETRPFPKPSEAGAFETNLVSSETHEFQETSPSETQHKSEHGVLEETKNIDSHHHNSSTTLEHGGEITSELQHEENMEEKAPSQGETNYHAGNLNYELTQNTTIEHHSIQGRPGAPQGETEATQKEAIVHSGQSSGSAESSATEEAGGHGLVINSTGGGHYSHSHHSTVNVQTLHTQQINYDTLIEELIQLESIPGHQAIDKCEEKIQEFLEILKYQQEQGFGRNQQELQRLHQTLIEQAQERSKQLAGAEETTLPPTSFWRRVQKKIKTTYDTAKDRAREVMG